VSVISATSNASAFAAKAATATIRLGAYIDRCTARPAFKRAFDAQVGDFREAA